MESTLKYLQRAGREPASPLVVLLHGFGANASDLAPLADYFDPAQHFHWIFPEAPLIMEEPDMPTAQVWFPNNRELQQAALAGQYFNTIATLDPPGLPESAAQVVRLIHSLDVGWDHTIIGGFSQGGMVAIEMLTHEQVAPRGLLLFSSVLTAPLRWKEGIKTTSPCSFLQTHGKDDEVLHYQDAVALYRLLCGGGFRGHLESFVGGHEIPHFIEPLVQTFLQQLIKKR